MASTPMTQKTKQEVERVIEDLLASHIIACENGFDLSVQQLYTQAIPPEGHAAIKTLRRINHGFMHMAKRLPLDFQGQFAGGETFRGTITLALPTALPVPQNVNHKDRKLSLPRTAKLYGPLQEWITRRVMLGQVNKRVNGWTSPLIVHSTTVSQLLYVWPEFVDFMSPHVRRRLGTTKGRGPGQAISAEALQAFYKQKVGINDWLMQAFLLGDPQATRTAVTGFAYVMT